MAVLGYARPAASRTRFESLTASPSPAASRIASVMAAQVSSCASCGCEAIIAVIGFRYPKRIPFLAKNIALFVAIRAVFISLTHIGPYPDQIPMDVFGENWLQHLTDNANFFIFSSGSDLFFSAHTGLPFLMALIYWKNKAVRLFCIFAAAFFGVVVLLGHLHYSIDVASAFFITYSIFHIAEWLFPADRKRFLT